MKDTERKKLISQYAKLALDNFRESAGNTATDEMRAIQQQLNMTHEEIMRKHEEVAMQKL